MFTPATANSLGLGNHPIRARVIARGASFNRGDVVQFDLAQTNSATTNNLVGSDASGLVNVITPTTSGVQSGILAVCTQDISQNQRGYVVLRDVIEAFVIKSAGSIAVGDRLVAINASSDLDGTDAAGERWTAIAFEAATTPSTHIRKLVAFDGINGFGTKTS
jgi:hypothetical protein